MGKKTTMADPKPLPPPLPPSDVSAPAHDVEGPYDSPPAFYVAPEDPPAPANPPPYPDLTHVAYASEVAQLPGGPRRDGTAYLWRVHAADDPTMAIASGATVTETDAYAELDAFVRRHEEARAGRI